MTVHRCWSERCAVAAKFHTAQDLGEVLFTCESPKRDEDGNCCTVPNDFLGALIEAAPVGRALTDVNAGELVEIEF